VYCSGVGEWTLARESINEAAGIFETAGDWRRWEQTATLQARNAFYQGDYEQSLSNYAGIHRAAIARGDLQNQCLGAFGQASNMLQLGRIDEALNFLTSIDYQSLPDAYRFEKFCAFGALSFARLIRSEYEQAKLMAVQALELDARADPRYASLPAKSFVARVLLTLAECNASTEGDARKPLDPLALQACRSLRKFAKVFPIGRPSARLWSGMYYWSSGKKKRAMKEWQKSLAEAKLRCLPHEEALCDYMIGRYSVGSERLEYLGRARDLLSFIGAEYDLSCVQSELNLTS
jgi:tetratricopeptide (TPR) repeat protein